MDNIFRPGAVISRGIKIYFRNFFSFTILVALVYSPLILVGLSLMSGDMNEEEINAITLLLIGGSFFLSLIASAAVMYGTFEQLRGRKAGIGISIVVGLKRMFPVLLVGLVMVVGLMFGFLALIIPGIMLMCRWWVAVPVAVVEKPGIFASLARSRDLTDGYRWQILGVMFLLNLIPQLLTSVLEAVFLTDNATMTDVKTYLVCLLIITTFMSGITAVVTCVGYHDLRQVKEGVDTDELASVFE